RDLRNRIQSVGHVLTSLKGQTEGVADGAASLFHGDTRQGRKTDHIAHAVHVWHPGTEVLLAPESSAVVGVEPGGGRVELDRGNDPAGGEQHAVADQAFTAFELHGNAVSLEPVHANHVFSQAEDHPQRAAVEQQRVDDFAVAEFEHLFAAIDDGHADAERGKNDGVLETDHAAAHDDRRAGD